MMRVILLQEPASFSDVERDILDKGLYEGSMHSPATHERWYSEFQGRLEDVGVHRPALIFAVLDVAQLCEAIMYIGHAVCARVIQAEGFEEYLGSRRSSSRSEGLKVWLVLVCTNAS